MLLKFESERLKEIADLLKNNKKYSFGDIKLGRYTLSVSENGFVVRQLMNLFFGTWPLLRFIQAGDKLMIVDVDIYLDVKFARIMTGQTPQGKRGSIGIRLVVN